MGIIKSFIVRIYDSLKRVVFVGWAERSEIKEKFMQKIATTVDDLSAEKPQWEKLAKDILNEAAQQGATSSEVSVSRGIGFTVSVRMGSVETVEYNRDKGIGVTVYFGKRKGSASSSDTTPESVKAIVRAACNIAKFSSEDPYAGLADAELLAKNYPDLDLYYPWSIDPEQAIQIALDCEQQARALDKRIVNSEGASVGSYQAIGIYGNSNGFIGGYPSSRHNISCTLVAQDSKGMQRDGYYSVARDPLDLESVSAIAKHAAERTVNRLGSRRIKTCTVPVIFQAEIARGLIGNFLSAISGGNLYRKASFLVDHLGKQVFASKISLQERPHIKKGLGSAPFDAEGVATHDRDLVTNGILQGYILGSYSARKLGMKSTGNSGGAHNMLVKTDNLDFPALLKKMGKGFLVTELLGQGVNLVTGDYSRGAAGFWVENGEIQFPVEEVTIAGNLRDMYLNLVAIGNDIERRGTIFTGSILLESMTVAGE